MYLHVPQEEMIALFFQLVGHSRLDRLWVVCLCDSENDVSRRAYEL